jgi:protein involved in polysaccharide export with SLBB domain
MKKIVCFGSLLTCLLLTACGGDESYTPANSGPAAMEGAPSSDVIRVGDKITVQLSGTPDGGWIHEKQIPASGDISVDLLTQSFHVAGKTPADVAAEITNAYKSQNIYTNPVITVIPEERYVNVGGDVRAPSNVVWRPDSTVMSTINACGGFDDYANRRVVRIIRGKQVLQVDCVKAASDPGADPPVYPGDQLYVPRTIL